MKALHEEAKRSPTPVDLPVNHIVTIVTFNRLDMTSGKRRRVCDIDWYQIGIKVTILVTCHNPQLVNNHIQIYSIYSIY